MEVDSKGKVQAHRHHVIPYATLRDFYNKLVEQKTSSDMDNLTVFFDQMIISTKKFNEHPEHKNKFANLADLHKYIKGMQSRKLLNDDKTTSRSGGYEDFAPYFTWIPGNLFIGPTSTLRSDEPGENAFEKNAGGIIPKAAFDALKTANEQMVKYIKNPTSAEVETLGKALTEILEVDDVYPLNKDQWKIDHSKKKPYSIKE